MKVEPIRNVKDIRSIKKLLSESPRDLALFVVGINTNLRASDILGLTIGQVHDLRIGDEIVLKERKTGKERRITVNAEVLDAITRLLESRRNGGKVLDDAEPLFVGQRGRMTVPTLSRMVSQWCEAINLKGNYGSHSMRKTFGYHQRTRLNTSVAELMVMFNHSNQRQTLDYLCIQPDEIREAYLKLSY
jgi:integrase